jgi:hypothetical protein
MKFISTVFISFLVFFHHFEVNNSFVMEIDKLAFRK